MSDITLLMVRDPLSLSNQDLDQIIAFMRTARSSFKSAPAAKAPTKMTKKEEEVGKAGLGLSLNLELKK